VGKTHSHEEDAMSARDLLRQRAAERDALVERAVDLLNDDRRVVAAWLYGSLGRGTQDQLSDVDLWVVVQDEYIDEVRRECREYVAGLGNPLVIVEAPQNAPPNGAFLTVLYEGRVAGPQHVDWTWQGVSAASLPSDAKILLRRVELSSRPPTPEAPEDRAGAASHEMAYFWMMVLVAAKYAVRGRLWEVVNLLSAVRHALDRATWLLGAGESPPEHTIRSGAPPPVEPIEQIVFLRKLTGEAEALTRNIGYPADAPSSTAMDQVHDYLDLVSQVIAESS
jgi:predicted nucleotidyltransferase